MSEPPTRDRDSLQVDAWSFDVGAAGSTVVAYAESCARVVEASWSAGADLVLLPEYTWAGLEPLLPAGAGLRGVAEVFWCELLPALRQRLAQPGKVAVLGTAPAADDASGGLRNRAVILAGNRLLAQDKLFLTPWEAELGAGDTLKVFTVQGLRVAVLICLDVEVPELSALLRGRGVDLLLVPSATDSELGCERVTRCASARAVELGCAVVVSPLVGRCAATLVNDNLGRLAAYLPSQAGFAAAARTTQSALLRQGFHQLRVAVSRTQLSAARALAAETNPARLAAPVRKIELTDAL